MRLLAIIVVSMVWVAACERPPESPPPPPWAPGVVYPTPSTLKRGLLDRRGLIHAHSVYSHDACDGMPEVDGVRDEVCFDDFRRGLCQVQHDFVMLTDHRDAFSDTAYPDTLLYRPDRDDELVMRGDRPVASWAACPDGRRAMVLAGAEAGTMPVGLEAHVAPREERSAIYGAKTPTAIEMLKASGAVVLAQHTETWTVDELAELPLDGFEMFNLHANSFRHLPEILKLVQRLEAGDVAGMPHPDLTVLDFISEDPRYLSKWGTALASGAHRVTTMGTDCHRNSFPMELGDGERIDSYRRMMGWFSNHLLVKPEPDGTWDDRHLKDALRSGRLYGAFEVMGYPVGFDYHATAAGVVYEMGEDVELSSTPSLVVRRPAVQALDGTAPAPVLTVRILRARPDGWDVVASSESDDVTYEPDAPGAYRSEVRMRPHHLTAFLGADAEVRRDEDEVWIYSNAIYVQ